MATITLVTAKNNVRIVLKGSGSASINWGNGSESKTLTVGGVIFTRTYPSSAVRTITITHSGVTSIECGQNDLTSLNVVGNPSLEVVSCFDNKLTLAATHCKSNGDTHQ
jgi:hypothetical protein